MTNDNVTTDLNQHGVTSKPPEKRAAFIGDQQIGETHPWESDVTEGDIHDMAWAILLREGRGDEWPQLEVRDL